MWAKLTNPKTRSYIYRIGILIAAFLGVKGFIDDHTVNFVNFLLAAVLAMADINVPRASERQAQAPPIVLNPPTDRP